MAGPRTRPDLLRPSELPARFGRYQLVALLGEGGMARVFQARPGRPVGSPGGIALKVVRSSVLGDDGHRRALINEARLGCRIKHENVVDIYELAEIDEHPCVAMELVEGVSLEELLRHEGPPPPRAAIDVMIQVCRGLHHVHELRDERGRPLQVVHRDLKPSNVMIDGRGRVRVMDLGIASAAHPHGTTTTVGTTKGSPAYMSPEQSRGEPLDRRSDLFTVGSLLHELLLGVRLFPEQGMSAVVFAMIGLDDATLAERLLPLRERHPRVERVVRRCVDPDPERRYPDAAAIARDLERLGRELDGPTAAVWAARSELVQRAASTLRGEERRGPRVWLVRLAAVAAAAALVGALAWGTAPDAPEVEVAEP